MLEGNTLRGSLTGVTEAKGQLAYKGERGYSNYELAVLNGYEGSEQDWLDHFGIDMSGYVKTSDVVDSLTSTSTSYPLSAKQGKNLKDSLDTLTTSVNGKINTSNIVDNLTTNDSTKVLSAKQGKVLKDTQDTVVSNIGTMSNLATQTTSSLVGAINGLASGEILEFNKGSNSGYIKYSNGVIFQYIVKSVTAGGTLWTNGIYYSDHSMGSWPVAMTSVFSYSASCNKQQFWTTTGSVSQTSAGTIRCLRPGSQTESCYLFMNCVGYWK